MKPNQGFVTLIRAIFNDVKRRITKTIFQFKRQQSKRSSTAVFQVSVQNAKETIFLSHAVFRCKNHTLRSYLVCCLIGDFIGNFGYHDFV